MICLGEHLMRPKDPGAVGEGAMICLGENVAQRKTKLKLSRKRGTPEAAEKKICFAVVGTADGNTRHEAEASAPACVRWA